ncbi:MAG: pyruvate kinase [Pseudodesulfovibrio sp.]|uniref:Pyruvate kinase n=1 Tax=Pseudodesulfovibrio aespoeensis (strain ATCC 700646 / DSM 10631 / Aspo-2) TaxID=643562 RepID=E6VVJ4_PSEA9|nr:MULTISPECIES: pyruvate kinase [Pseudodesulfovibrio]ADU63552.1 pyruvate kinase [Pseudodesulfovibrio aespoeensis Aspo-2]MBV1764800.1 pyruvate kinase [Pseudodesulfovibrio sp.]MBV1772163.1 pyruvate kinase [Pseudodesulfovibrio sp.]
MKNTLRRTKIVATLGPATSDRATLRNLIQAGVDVVRLNFSHGTAQDHIQMAVRVRELASELNRTVGVLADLQGPKIRIRGFESGSVVLKEGQSFIIDPSVAVQNGTSNRVGITYPSLAEDVSSGTILLLDDGKCILEVDDILGNQVRCIVITGGVLSGGKGVNVLSGGLSAGALTDKDREDMTAVATMQADYLALSFVRNAADVDEARDILAGLGWHGSILAKIERAEALEYIETIIMVSDGIMVARGDLGVEIGDAKLPAVQKMLIKRARSLNRVVITATQMMDSMITNPIPTRAEVFDVANAVLDGTDGVMLSAETAVGKYPVEVVAAMDVICLEAEKQEQVRHSRHRVDMEFTHVDETVAMSAMYAANHTETVAIGAFTESGGTPLWMSRISSGIPIFALSQNEQTRRRVSLYRGVYPINFNPASVCASQQHEAAAAELVRLGVVKPGDLVITTSGDTAGERGGTNSMRICRVEKYTR